MSRPLGRHRRRGNGDSASDVRPDCESKAPVTFYCPITQGESEHFPPGTATCEKLAVRRRGLSAGKQTAVVRCYATQHGLKIVRECWQGGGDGEGGALA
jgi:hypothetical protein